MLSYSGWFVIFLFKHFPVVTVNKRISFIHFVSIWRTVGQTRGWRQLELRRDRRCRERNYTARARGNRCSSENIQEATSWAGNTTVSKVFDDKKKGRERGGGKEDVLCRSQVAK